MSFCLVDQSLARRRIGASEIGNVMDLDSIIDSVVPPNSRGRKPRGDTVATFRREVNEADILALQHAPEGSLGLAAAPLLRIRTQHHMLARLLAEGRSQNDCSLITGYSPSYISTIQGDPAMNDLIAYYKTQVEEIFIDVHSRLAALGLTTIEELQARITENPNDFSARELMELATLTLDRSGHGPTAKVKHDHNFTISSDTIARIKAESAERTQGTVRSIDPQSHRGTFMGGPVIDGSLGEAAPVKRLESQGDNLPEQDLPALDEDFS